jgi:hypothetical protein
MKQHRYTPQQLLAEQQRLAAELKRRERQMKQQWSDLVSPPDYQNSFRRWASRAETAFSLVDCFTLGFRLWRGLSGRFAPKRKSRRQRW